MSETNSWIKKLERESWNLELLVTGFTIFILISAIDPVAQFEQSVRHHAVGHDLNIIEFAKNFAGILDQILYIILVNLFIHLFLRGLWIASIGLKSVSGETQLKTLKYSPYFFDYLNKRLTGFEKFLARIDQISSTIFAFTFLMVFIIISITVNMIFLGVIGFTMDWARGSGSTPALAFFMNIILLVYAMLLVLYAIDFLTGGFFKKHKEIQFIYKPVYLFFSITSLSFLYRPLYYTFISNKITRRGVYFILPYSLLLILFSSMSINGYQYFPSKSSAYKIHHQYYDELRNPNQRLGSATIPSYEVEKNYIPLFITYRAKRDDQIIAKKCPNVQPLSELGWRFNHHIEHEEVDESQVLTCLENIYEIYIDSIQVDPEFIFHQHANHQQFGIMDYIYLDDLKRGRHVLRIKKDVIDRGSLRDTIKQINLVTIPFEYVR